MNLRRLARDYAETRTSGSERRCAAERRILKREANVRRRRESRTETRVA